MSTSPTEQPVSHRVLLEDDDDAVRDMMNATLDRGRRGFSVDPIDGQLHEAHAQNGSVAGLLRFRAIGNKLQRGLRSFFSHR